MNLEGLEVVEVDKKEKRKKGEPLEEVWTAKLESGAEGVEWVKIRTKDKCPVEVEDLVTLSVAQRQAKLSEAEEGGE